MRHIKPVNDLVQNALFDSATLDACCWWATDLTDSARRRLEECWPGIFRRSLLKLMPAKELGDNFDPSFGRPTKELYSMAALVFIMEFKNWTLEDAVDAYTFDNSIHFALNLPNRSNPSASQAEKISALHDIAGSLEKPGSKAKKPASPGGGNGRRSGNRNGDKVEVLAKAVAETRLRRSGRRQGVAAQAATAEAHYDTQARYGSGIRYAIEDPVQPPASGHGEGEAGAEHAHGPGLDGVWRVPCRSHAGQ